MKRLGFLLALTCVSMSGQTTVSETASITMPGGGLASGTITITPSADFVSANGLLVERTRKIVVTVTGGSMSVVLPANDTADPSNTRYNVEYSLRYSTCPSCRSLTRAEQWVVPTAGTVTIADVVFVGGGGGGGSGDVTGPAAAVDNRVSRFNGLTGKLIKNSNATMDDAGFLTEGIGVITGHNKELGNAGDSAASSLTIRPGDTAAEPPYLSMPDNLGNVSTLFPCGSLAGRWCQDAVVPGSAYTNPLLSRDSLDTVSGKSFATGGAAFLGYFDATQISAPANPVAGILRVYAKTGAGICWRDSAGVETCAGGGGGAPADAQYLTLALNGGLTAERVLTPRDGLVATDAGANGNFTLDVDVTDPRVAGFKDEFGVSGASNLNIGEMGWTSITIGAAPTFAKAAGSFTNPGVTSVTTSATSGQGGGICTGTTAGNRALGDLSTNSDKFWRMAWVFRLPTAGDAADVRFRIGAGSCNATAQLNDFIGLRYDTSVGFVDGNFQLFVRAASGTEAVSDTGVPPDTNFHTLMIYSDGATANRIFVKLDNGTPVSFCAVGCDVLTAPPAVNYDAVATIVTDTIAAKAMHLDFFAYKARVSTNLDRRN